MGWDERGSKGVARAYSFSKLRRQATIFPFGWQVNIGSIYYVADGPTQKKTVLTRFSETAVILNIGRNRKPFYAIAILVLVVTFPFADRRCSRHPTRCCASNEESRWASLDFPTAVLTPQSRRYPTLLQRRMPGLKRFVKVSIILSIGGVGGWPYLS